MFHRRSNVIAQTSAIRSSWSLRPFQQKYGFAIFSLQNPEADHSVHRYRQLVSPQRRTQSDRRFSSISAMNEASHNLDIIIPENGKPYVKLAKVNEMEEMLEIQPSYPQKPKAVQNLVKGLSEILGNAAPNDSSVSNFSTQSWYLDESGRAIHRHFELHSEDEVENLKRNVKDAADEINHHPHITAEELRLTITCATHNPPGLSVKDVKLAKRIDELVSANSSGLPQSESSDSNLESILSDRIRDTNKNMSEVTKAQEECSCGH